MSRVGRMNPRTRLITLVLYGVIALAVGCGGGGDSATDSSGQTTINPGMSSGAFCRAITGGNAAVTSTCTGCTLDNPRAVADADLYTFTNITPIVPVTGFTSTVRATAQSGVTYGTSAHPGAFITVYGELSNIGIVINTYNAQGVLAGTSSGTTNSSGTGGTPAQLYVDIPLVTQPFSSVEIVTTAAGGNNIAPSDSPYLQIYEICADGGFN